MRHLRWFVAALALFVLLFSAFAPSWRLVSADAPWGPSVKVNDGAGTTNEAWPAIAVDASGNAYAVWYDTRELGAPNIYFAFRPSGGSWEPNVKVNESPGAVSPRLAVDVAGNAYVVWRGYVNNKAGIYFSYRPAGGSWGPSVQVNEDRGTTLPYGPNIAVDRSGNAYAIWTEQYGPSGDIYFSYRPAGGSWGPGVLVNDASGTANQEFPPGIAVEAAGNAYAVWMDARGGALYAIYFSYRPNGGSWGPNVRINDNTWSSWNIVPNIAADDAGNAYVVWMGGRGGADIYFSYRPAGGPWQANVRVNDDYDDRPWGGQARQSFPAVAVDAAGNAYAVWEDYRNAATPNEYSDIYASARPAGGSWGANVKVNNDRNRTDHLMPSVAVNQRGFAYVVWADYRVGPGWPDIYFATTTVALPYTWCPMPVRYWTIAYTRGLWPVTSLTLGSQTYTQPELWALLGGTDTRDASLVLAKQLIAAKLNIAKGSNPAPASSTVADADSIFSQYAGKLPYHVNRTSQIGLRMLSDWTDLDNYNRGLLSPGCVVSAAEAESP